MGMASKSFDCREFIPKLTWNYWQDRSGNGDLGMRFIYQQIPIVAQFLRDSYNKSMIINNWHLNLPIEQTFDGRVLRLSDDRAYTLYSAHSRAMAMDFNIVGLSSQEVYLDILYKFSSDLLKLGVTCMEQNTNGWTHIGFEDCSKWGFEKQSGIYLIPLPQRQTMGVVK